MFGSVTGILPRMGISPNRAFTAAVSDVGALENVQMYVGTLGKSSARYGLPIATITAFFPAACNTLLTSVPASPASETEFFIVPCTFTILPADGMAYAAMIT